MADLGSIAIMLGLGLALYSMIGSVAGRAAGAPNLVVSARRAAYLTLPVTAAAVAALVSAFVSNDFSIKYVYEHSNLAMDKVFTWVALYAGNEGSLLYIAFVLAVMAVASIRLAPRRFERAMPYTTGILMGVLAFFFAVMVFWANPFALLGFEAQDGRGINPLLLHPGMFSHPPLLMAGLAGITMPFAFATGALIAGSYGDDWVDAARVSGIIVWAILGTGLLLGAWWAYTILGWGGYWSWDPIENVAFMPWLVMTAFLHSIMVQKRRGMFRMWNVVLLAIAFVLAQFGMFINRGGPVVSVHSFAASTIGLVFLSFMLLSLVFAFGVFFWRYPNLKSDRPLESFLSREASFLINNFLLLGIAFVTLWGVIFPLFAEFANDETISVGAPFYNRINGPMFLGLVALMGIGPLVPWRRSTGRSLWRWLAFPAAVGLAVITVLLATGLDEPLALVAFGTVSFVAAAIGTEWYRGVMARRRGGELWLVAWWRLIASNRPRHGGYIVHIAILILSIGVIGTTFYHQRADVALRPGESAVLDDYRVEFVDIGTETRSDRLARWANLNIYRVDPSQYEADPEGYRTGPRTYQTSGRTYPGDSLIARLAPWHGLYPAFNMASVRAGIRSTPVEDLYIVPSEFLEDGRVVLRLSINPLAWWLWMAGPVFVLGAVFALWPQAALEPVSMPSRRTAATVSAPASAGGT